MPAELTPEHVRDFIRACDRTGNADSRGAGIARALLATREERGRLASRVAELESAGRRAVAAREAWLITDIGSPDEADASREHDRAMVALADTIEHDPDGDEVPDAR